MKRRRRFLLPAITVLALIGVAFPAGATHNQDRHRNMDLLFQSPKAAVNSDLAFWGNHLFIGYYTGDAASQGGVRIFDISNPASPVLLRDFPCDGQQNDPIVWDRDGNGVADLLMLAVDRTMASPECGAPRTAHGDPMGWEGVRIFEMSDDPKNPFATIEQVAAVYTDCGAHTITLWPGEAEKGKGKGKGAGRLLVYVSSYPLRAGPTCGDTEFMNTANPYDGDPGSPADPLHGVIQIVEVPLDDPAASRELDVQPEIQYPGDPDNQIDWCERGGLLCPPVFEPAARACHDIAVHVEHRLAGAACAEQGQVWHIDENGIPDTLNPIMIGDDEVTSGGTGDIPGAVDFFHSVMFDNDATVVNWVDESFDFDGDACPPMTPYQPRPWNPAGGVHKTGRMFFSDLATGAFLSEFQVGDLRPEPGAYCSAHMGMAVMDIKRDLLVNAWYQGGVNVIDFTNPKKLREIAFYDIAPLGPGGSDNWSAYPYVGPRFMEDKKDGKKDGKRDFDKGAKKGKGKAGVPVYASDGLGQPTGRGLLVFRAFIEQPTVTRDHLNPQTMD